MHICEIPVNAPARRRWWTCEECGQVWTRINALWTLTPRDDHSDAGATR